MASQEPSSQRPDGDDPPSARAAEERGSAGGRAGQGASKPAKRPYNLRPTGLCGRREALRPGLARHRGEFGQRADKWEGRASRGRHGPWMPATAGGEAPWGPGAAPGGTMYHCTFSQFNRNVRLPRGLGPGKVQRSAAHGHKATARLAAPSLRHQQSRGAWPLHCQGASPWAPVRGH